MAGRPPKYKDESELQQAIDKYFKEGIDKKKQYTKDGIEYEVEVPTITGLCYFLGFESRQSFYDLADNPEFSYTIKKARLFIEKLYEEQLSVGNTTGAIFALKNMGWIDKTNIDHTTKDKEIENKTFIVADKNTADLLKELQKE